MNSQALFLDRLFNEDSSLRRRIINIGSDQHEELVRVFTAAGFSFFRHSYTTVLDRFSAIYMQLFGPVQQPQPSHLDVLPQSNKNASDSLSRSL